MSSVPQTYQNAWVQRPAEPNLFETQLRRAEIMAEAPFLPDAFRGNAGAVLIAVELADRLGLPVMATIQNIYVVHGKPAFSGAFFISCINASGRYSPVEYEERNESGKLVGCRVAVRRRSDGKEIFGPWVTLDMARAEGWLKNNPKWSTMPELMLRYRAAAFFARTNCPEVVLGFAVEGEAEDIANAEAAAAPASIHKIEPTYTPDLKITQYAEALKNAPDLKTLKEIQTAIGLDKTLSKEDKDFLRPIAAGKGKELDK